MMDTATVSIKAAAASARRRFHLARPWRLKGVRWSGWRDVESPPVGTPYERAPDAVESAGSYACGDPAWAYVGSSWHRGLILYATGGAALVCYQIPGIGGVGVETVPAAHLIRRDQPPGRSEHQDDPEEVVQARTALLLHRADTDGLCAGHLDLARFCLFPCPEAKTALSVLAHHARRTLGQLP